MKKKIGIIGYGNMGSAIAGRIRDDYAVAVFDADAAKTSGLAADSVAGNMAELAAAVDVLILAVKPQDFDPVLAELKTSVSGKLVISIAAGITTGYIEKQLNEARVVRVMPNIGAKIGEAETSVCKGKSAGREDFDFTMALFAHIGKTWGMDETMIDAATAISGSGPAYIFYDMERKGFDPSNIPEEARQSSIKRLAKAAEMVGFDPQTAMDLAVNTSATSIHLVQQSGLSPTELRRQVTSKGGTTEAALKILEAGGSWEEAAEAAMKR
ncbi:MAG: pyrroline-5-carboxylate reductase, partial [Candidatus Omnitrophica bacterium]|nr:pyrroline-5-carboxylate reductase [Candidatus Omnitrophota bacterium]